MAAQANPPSPAYAYGYIRNAHAHARPRPRAQNSTRLPAQRSLPPGLHDYPPSHPRSSTGPRPSPTKERTTTILAAERSSDKFMETVDYRYHDPPSRPCVPWLEGYTSPRREVITRQQQESPHEDPSELVLPHFSSAESPTVSARAGISKCGSAGSASGSDNAPPKKKKNTKMASRSRVGTSVDVVKINRLDIVLSALRRACGLSAKEGRCKPSLSS